MLRLPLRHAVVVLAALAAAAPGVALAQDPSTDVSVAGLDHIKDQWAFSSDALFNVQPAWKISQGQGVVVAVVDTGTKLDHPDLAPNIWTNFREVPDNGVDDDGNGYVDDVHGIDLTTTGKTNDLSDGHSHGTHVAGIIAAVADNKGVVGVAPKAKIMTLKAMDANGQGTTNAVAEGVRYAAANGARVINLSLEAKADNPVLRDAIKQAEAANALVVVAAGNEGVDIDKDPVYPAAVPAQNVLAVAATEPSAGRDLGPYSNFGRNTVQVAAPGSFVLSTSNNGGYVEKSGTSMATPHVAGVAALVAAANPALSGPEIRAIIMQSARHGNVPVGSGYVDALAAVQAATGQSNYNLGQRPELQIVKAESARRKRVFEVVAQIRAQGALDSVKRYRLRVPGASPIEVTAAQSQFTARIRLAPGRRSPGRVTVTALDASGRSVAQVSGRVSRVQLGKTQVKGGQPVGTAAVAHGEPPAARPAGRGPLAGASSTLRIGGAPVEAPLVADLAFYYRRAVRNPPRFSIVGGGSDSAVADVSRGIIDVGMVARNLLPSDASGVVETPFALSAICLVTNKANPVANFTRAEVQQLVSGQLTNWTGIAGSPRTDEIVAAGSPPGIASRTVFLNTFVDPSTQVTYTPRAFASPSSRRLFVLGQESSWAYIDFAFTEGLHVVTYEGVGCSRETIAAGSYPARVPLSFATRGKPRGAAARFIQWVRTSRKARQVITRRYIPVR